MPKAPGKSYRVGLSLVELFDLFPDEPSAERWWIASRWPNGIACPRCGSVNIQTRRTRKPQPYRCRDCRYDFSAKTGSLMQGSPLGFRTWAIAIYLLTTGLKGTSSMKLHRDVKVTQKTAWFLAHRIRETWAERNNRVPFTGPVEADETFIGGLGKNMHRVKRRQLTGRGGVDKMVVAGVLDQGTKQVRTVVLRRSSGPVLRGFVTRHTVAGAAVYTDETQLYAGIAHRETVKHGIGEYVRGAVTTNGMESFWSMFKRGYHGTYHKMSPKHLPRYVAEFEGRHNDRSHDTIDQMVQIVRGMDRKRLRYEDLIRDTDSPSPDIA